MVQTNMIPAKHYRPIFRVHTKYFMRIFAANLYCLEKRLKAAFGVLCFYNNLIIRELYVIVPV